MNPAGSPPGHPLSEAELAAHKAAWAIASEAAGRIMAVLDNVDSPDVSGINPADAMTNVQATTLSVVLRRLYERGSRRQRGILVYMASITLQALQQLPDLPKEDSR